MAPYSCGPFSTRPMPWFTSLKAIRQTGSLREGTQTLLAKRDGKGHRGFWDLLPQTLALLQGCGSAGHTSPAIKDVKYGTISKHVDAWHCPSSPSSPNTRVPSLVFSSFPEIKESTPGSAGGLQGPCPSEGPSDWFPAMITGG